MKENSAGRTTAGSRSALTFDFQGGEDVRPGKDGKIGP